MTSCRSVNLGKAPFGGALRAAWGLLTRQQARALTSFGLALVAAIIILYLLQLRTRIEAALANARLQSQNLAEVLAEHTRALSKRSSALCARSTRSASV